MSSKRNNTKRKNYTAKNGNNKSKKSAVLMRKMYKSIIFSDII